MGIDLPRTIHHGELEVVADPASIEFLEVRKKRSWIAGPEDNHRNVIRGQGYPRDLFPIIGIRYQTITCLYTVDKPLRVKSRDVRSSTGTDNFRFGFHMFFNIN